MLSPTLTNQVVSQSGRRLSRILSFVVLAVALVVDHLPGAPLGPTDRCHACFVFAKTALVVFYSKERDRANKRKTGWKRCLASKSMKFSTPSCDAFRWITCRRRAGSPPSSSHSFLSPTPPLRRQLLTHSTTLSTITPESSMSVSLFRVSPLWLCYATLHASTSWNHSLNGSSLVIGNGHNAKRPWPTAHQCKTATPVTGTVIMSLLPCHEETRAGYIEAC